MVAGLMEFHLAL